MLSNEPGYYRPGHYGIRIENLIYVKDAEEVAGGDMAMLSFETLTWCPIDRCLILPELLTGRSEEHTSELQSLMRISYAVFCLKNKQTQHHTTTHYTANQ